MGIKFTDLNNVVKPLDIEYAGQVVHIQYKPSAITPDVVDEWRENEGDRDTLIPALLDAVQSWDIVDEVEGDDGKTVEAPMPITEANLRRFPVEFLNAMLFEIVGAGTPKPTKKQPSGGSTRRKVR